jgi:tight adherence protein B
MPIFWAVLSFLAVGLLVAGALLFSGSAPPSEVAHRLQALARSEIHADAPADVQITRDESLSTVPALHRMMKRWSWSKRLNRLLSQAGLQIKPGKLVLIMGVAAFGTYVVMHSLFDMSSFAVAIGLGAGSVPLLVVLAARQKRLRAFERNFPEAIDLLGRAVRAGHAFTTGIEMISQESQEPIASEFRTMFEEHNLGLPLREALWNLADRVPLVDMRFFVSALLIQKETGGNLAEILDNLAHVIRERFKVLGEIRVRTAQGRLTAVILIALPPSLLVFLNSASPEYVQVLITDPLGVTMLTVAVAMQVIGSFLLWRVVSIAV